MVTRYGIDCTDVTGFGLLGAIWNLIIRQRIDVVLVLDSVPPFSRELLAIPVDCWTDQNFASFGDKVEGAEAIDSLQRNLLFSSQVCGPFLVIVKESDLGDVLRALDMADFREAAVIGKCRPGCGGVYLE
ncbi:MAG: hypothetical protein HC888_09635 [Candidatus Competibacteraceae bacterium]|nr:hypothetical protein [Candidatus Competibacteraceae bacterium]